MTAVEPSAALRARSPPHLAPALDAVAEQLPRPAGSFDAAMTTVTTAATTAVSAHLWSAPAPRLRAPRRTAPRPGRGADLRSGACPADRPDGFNGAYHGRPERLPAPAPAGPARSFVDGPARARFVAAFRRDLADDTWGAHRGAPHQRPFLDGPLILLCGLPD